MQLPCDDRRRPQRKDVEVICLPIKTLHITNCYHASSGGIRTFYHALLDAANQRAITLVFSLVILILKVRYR